MRDGAHYDALVEVVEYLGDEQLAHVRLGEAEIVAKLPIETALEPGRQETFAVPFKDLHLFDAESGDAVRAD